MKYRVLFLFLLSLSPSLSRAASGDFCIQTFNVYATAYASNVDYRISRTAEALLRQPCDSIQFQEIWQKRTFENFAGEFSASGMQLIFADSLRRDQAMIGLSSAFRGKLGRQYSEIYRVNNEDGFLDWFRNLSGVQKGLTMVEASLEHGPKILYLNTHTHPTNETIRTAQMIQLLTTALIQSPGSEELPLVFTADLNATPDSLEMALLRNVLLLRDAYLESHGGNYGAICTYCESNPLSWGGGDRVIDYTLFRSSPTVTLRASKSELDLQGDENGPLSDHYGVRSELAFSEHTPELLPADSALVLDRKALAIKTLERARQLLADGDNEVYGHSIEQADQLLRTLRGRSPDTVETIFRIP